MFFLSNLLHCCNKPPSTHQKVVGVRAEPDSMDPDGLCCRRPADLDVTINFSNAFLEGALTPPAHLGGLDPLEIAADAGGLDPLDLAADADSSLRFRAASSPRVAELTQGQRDLKDRVWLPAMTRSPAGADSAAENARIAALLQVFQAFVLDMHAGVCLTQINSDDDYADMHLQLQDDLATLKVDQGSGCIVEFPLTAVTRVYRIVRNEGKGGSAASTLEAAVPLDDAEHIVVVEFRVRKLVLVFDDMRDAQSFLMCMELLVRFAQEASARRRAQKSADRARSWWPLGDRESQDVPKIFQNVTKSMEVFPPLTSKDGGL